MAYAEWHGSIVKHHKTVWLGEFLGVNKREALGIRGALIGWTVDNRPGGYVERNLLSFACEWDGDASKLEKSLIDAKLIDEIDEQTVYIHDWPEYTKGFRKARKDARRKKLERKRVTKTSTDSPRTQRGQSTERRGDLTRPDQSRPEQNGAEYGAEPSKPTSHAPPSELSGLTLYEQDAKLCRRWPELLRGWKTAFPGVNVVGEIRKAHAWEVANPTRIKKDRPRFLFQWLSRSQDQARGPAPLSMSDANGKTKCLNCGGTGKIADGIAIGGGIKMADCRHCQKKGALA